MAVDPYSYADPVEEEARMSLLRQEINSETRRPEILV